jgi:lipoprotein-anchoring transpeptidase ErfK/SrfK
MLTRRTFIATTALGLAAGRAAPRSSTRPPPAPLSSTWPPRRSTRASPCPPTRTGDFVIPERYRARVVNVAPGLQPSSIHIVPASYYLYFVLPGDQAIRYGVAVGQEGLGWRGSATIGRKVEWPSWRPD